LGLYKNLFKQTFIYGVATVLPRMLSFILVRLHTDLMPKSDYGDITIVLSWMVFFNVILSYGMETAFFRFYNKEENKKGVIETASLSIFWSSLLFLALGLLNQNSLADWAHVEKHYVVFAIWILVFDALSVIPFAKLRVYQRSLRYAVIKISNVAINLGLNVFFLVYLPKIVQKSPDGFWSSIFIEDFKVGYVFVANLIASLFNLLLFIPHYFSLRWKFNFELWKQMLRYGWPILFAGIAFGINEHFDKILLAELLPKNIAKAEVGAYSACYKLGLFMVLFRTAYTLGIEPFFFSHASAENATKTYAVITKYFVIFGSFILLSVVVFADVLKLIFIPNNQYWGAMKVIPLIVLANFCLGIYTSLSVWYKLIDKTIIGAYISVVGAIITLLFNYLLIPKYSYMGSAVATLMAYGSMMVISYYLGNKHYPIPYEKRRIGAYLLTSITFSGLVFYIDALRYHIIFGILAIIIFGTLVYYFEQNTIRQILKRKST
jgi:O-antigen/teichoic acid export membrane protein